MADDSKVLITGLVTVGIAVTAYLWYQAPLMSSRPVPGEESDLASHAVTARLWEDPLEAAEAHAKAKRKAEIDIHLNAGAGGSLTGSVSMVHDDPSHHRLEHVWKGAASRGTASVLLVMTDGSPYPEGHEVRLSTRYAIVSALRVGCYISKGDLQYFQWPENPPSGSANAGSGRKGNSVGEPRHDPDLARKPWTLPYEWYDYRAQPAGECSRADVPQRVLVLWVNTDAIKEAPLEDLTELAETLCSLESARCRDVDFNIIGPPDSDTFLAMIRDVLDNFSKDKKLTWPGGRYVELFSPWVTAADRIILEEFELQQVDLPPTSSSNAELKARNVLSLILSIASVDIRYKVTQDHVLFMELMQELDRRNVDPAHDPIALVGELDSFHARAFSKEFLAATCAWEYLDQMRLRRSTVPHFLRVGDRPLRKFKKEQPCVRALAKRFGAQNADGEDTERFGDQDVVGGEDVLEEALNYQSSMSESSTGDLLAIDASPHQIAPNIRRYSYLRGLDGLVAHKTPTDGRKGSDKKADGMGKSRERALMADNLERPEGESQFDYLRRLVARIKTDEQRSIKAIGVLGSDIYDRLLILQALRREFPGVVFFMTDLDARLFQPSQYDWSRNVVVSSALGLELEKGLQGEIPPFRNSYQTSVFFAVLQSVKRVEKPFNHCRDEAAYAFRALSRKYTCVIAPRLFEVGRHGPVDISTNPPSKPASIHPLPPFPARGRPDPGHEAEGEVRSGSEGTSLGERAASSSSWYFGFAMSIIVLTIPTLAFVLFTIPAAWKFVKRHQAFYIGLLAMTVGLAVLEPWLVRQSEEPFSLFDGISTWPAIGIRALAVILSWYFLAESWKALRKSDADLPTQYPELRNPADTRTTTRSLWGTFRWLLGSPTDVVKATSWQQVQEVWAAYKTAGTRSHRIWRMAIVLVPYCVFIVLLLWLVFGVSRPWVPCRGTLNCGMELVILIIAILLLVVLNFFVFDATRLCKAFVDRLIEEPSDQTQKIHASHYRRLIQLIADRTKTVGPLVYYPFIVLSLMIVSRSRYFDDWDFPAWLIIIWIINAALVFWSAYTLKRAADDARDRAMQNLDELIGPQSGSAEQIRGIKEEIKRTREGSFDHILQQPAVSASLLAALAALQYYFTT
jgi:hypothetical protein